MNRLQLFFSFIGGIYVGAKILSFVPLDFITLVKLRKVNRASIELERPLRPVHVCRQPSPLQS